LAILSALSVGSLYRPADLIHLNIRGWFGMGSKVSPEKGEWKQVK